MKRLQLDIPLMDKPTLTPTPHVQNHPEGNAFIENNIPLVSPQYDADVKTGRALALGATNDLPIPIHNNGGANSFLTYHDIANDEIIQIGNAVDGGSSKEFITNGTFDTSDLSEFSPTSSASLAVVGGELECTTVAGAKGVLCDVSCSIGDTFIISVDVLTQVAGGTVKTQFYDGVSYVYSVSSLGNHSEVVVATGTFVRIYLQQTLAGVFTSDNWSIKKILPTSTEYILNDVTVNNILTHQMPFSEGDLTLIQQEPNLLAALAMGEATPISSVTLDADDSWYACGEVSGAEVFDARVASNDTTITGDLTSVRITNQQKGLQTTALLLDANGVPESYNSTANTARVYDDTIISTGFKPSIARYSIEEESSGLMQDFGSELQGTMNDATAWAAYGTNIIEQDGDAVKTTYVDNANGGGINLTSNGGLISNLENGKSYLISMMAKVNTGEATIRGSDGAALTTWITVSSTEYKAVTYILTAAIASSCNMRTSGLISGQTIWTKDISIKELTTKTHRTEKRVLTHNDVGDLFAGAGAFNTLADFDSFFQDGVNWTWDASGFAIRPPGLITSHFHKVVPTVAGRTYLLQATANITSGDAEYFVGNAVIGTTVGEDYQFIAGADNLEVGVVSANGNFNFDNLTLKGVEPETRYYIDDVEQTVVPPLPDPDTTINLGNVAVIGYPDTIESREADFNVHSEVIIP